MDLEIKHDQSQHSFYIIIDGQRSELNYKKVDNSTLDYYHTFVPKPLRQQGIASKLTKFALDYARQHSYSVIASCPYVTKYLDQHPEYADIREN